MAHQQRCFFSALRISEKEIEKRNSQSDVSITCGGNVTSFRDLFLKNSTFPNKSIAEVILARGAATFETIQSDFEHEIICENHQKELYFKWDSQTSKHIIFGRTGANAPRKPVCSFPAGYDVNHGQHRPFTIGNIVTFENAENFLEKEKMLLHVGLPVCPGHKKYLESMKSNEIQPMLKTNSEKDAAASSSSSSDYQPTKTKKNLEKPKPIVSEEILNSVVNFAKAADITNVLPFLSYSEYAEDTRRKKIETFKQFMKIIAKVMAPDDPDALLEDVSKKPKKENKVSNQIDKLLNQVVDNYLSASNDRERNEILSQVAYAFPLNTLLEYFPHLTRNRYSNARKTALVRTLTKKPISIGHIKVRYSKPLINLFIEFITSPLVMVDLPFGTQKIKFSSGLRTEIPNSIRKHRDNEICLMFDHYMEQTGRGDQKLSKSTKKKILKICKASRRIALQCVDYYMAEGSEAFDELHNTVEKIFENRLINESQKKEIRSLLQQSHHYLKTDYRMNVKSYSRCADHCISYALSDPTNEKFSSIQCQELEEDRHNHDLQCERCMLFRVAIKKLKKVVNEKLNETEEANELFDILCEFIEIIEKCELKVDEYKKHLLRSVFSDLQRAWIIKNLKNGEAFVTMDYAQKWIPRKSNQQQRDYYAQKGLSWHICHIFAMINGKLWQHCVTHLMGFEKQSAKAVTTIARDLLTKLKSWNISSVSFRSDNASNYRNIELMVNLYYISIELGIEVNRYSFSEVQNGKGSADMECARLKRRMKDSMDSGNDIESPIAMYRSLHYGTISLCAMTVVVANVDGKDNASKKPLPGITKISDFVFDYEKHELIYWQYYGIGDGQRIKIDDFKSLVLNAKLKISKETENTPEAMNYTFWRPSHVATNEIEKEFIDSAIEENEDEHEIDPEEEAPNPRDEAIFFCPENGCQRFYVTYGNLQRHMVIGKHQYAPERCTLQDYALKTYARNLEGASATNCLPEITEMLGNFSESNETVLQKGWAIRERAPRIIYTNNMKEFLDAEFETAQKNKQRINPKNVQEQMSTLQNKNGKMRFKVAERLSSIQIGRYFASKLKKLREDENDEEEDDETCEADELLHEEPMFSDTFEAVCEEIGDYSELIPPGKENGEWDENAESSDEETTPINIDKKITPKKRTPQKKPTPKSSSKKTPKKRNSNESESTPFKNFQKKNVTTPPPNKSQTSSKRKRNSGSSPQQSDFASSKKTKK